MDYPLVSPGDLPPRGSVAASDTLILFSEGLAYQAALSLLLPYLKANLAVPDSVQAALSALVDSAPGALDTLKELATALGNDANFATSTAAALANRVRFDAAQSLSAGQAEEARANIGLADGWASKAIGEYVAIASNLTGVVAPPTDKNFRFIKLTAADAYNSGFLTSETVSGSAPLVSATAVISMPTSPMNGQTVRLINTERRFLRAGSAGAIEDDQMQQIVGTLARYGSNRVSFIGSGAFTSTAGTDFPVAVGSTAPTAYNGDVLFNSANSSGARTGTETRGKNIGATFYMRIK